MPPESRRAISDDADYLVQRCLLKPGDERWSSSRERRGVVMGAVQSGKTASMMAVIAKGLDAGVDGVVVLAGTRTALWLQTLSRVDDQLDRMHGAAVARLRLPPPGQRELVGGELSSLYSLTDQQVLRALSKRRPLLAIVMKNVAHLEQLSRTLHETVYPAVAEQQRDFHLLVIDDEADDSSIDDPGVGPAEVRQVPRRILDLWESRQQTGSTALSNLYATYVAYTATPQANFLQDPSNPLAPRDFVMALRTPGPDGDVEVRSPTFRVAKGYRSWYTGGEVFYHHLQAAPLCVEAPDTAAEALTEGVRAFLVASAIRDMRSGAKLSPATAVNKRFSSKSDAVAAIPPVASMLVHPSSALDDHFTVAEDLVAWSRGPATEAGQVRRLGVEGIREDMQDNLERWLNWLQSYRATADQCVRELGASQAPWVPAEDSWAEVSRVILEDIVPGTTVAVINSDERADNRPEFSVQRDGEAWRAPRNLSTIFVSGNVMARGITLEGLSTTVFTRETNDPLADTQMQMQRWFGYRGPYVELCRVLAGGPQLRLFRQYHDNDEALRRQIIAAMGAERETAPPVSVLQGLAFRATGRVSEVRGRRMWPGGRPFVQQMNSPDKEGPNAEFLAEMFASGARGVPDEHAGQGLISNRTLSLEATAALLDSLIYPALEPTAVERWQRAQEQIGVQPRDPLYPLYRGPVTGGRPFVGLSPFDIAAYLRTWAVLLERRAPGFFTTDEPPLQWSLLDLDERRRRAPVFRVGLRFGSAPSVVDGPWNNLPVPVRPMRRTVRDRDVLDSTWGSRGESEDGIFGDEFFDYFGTGERPDLTSSGMRRAGEPGLVLFHLVSRPDDGTPTVAVGVSLPAGGPDQVIALGAARGGHDGSAR
ncbi:Z1 domain-containing protein [Nocardioides koreensis]|uniref:Z1 domain-containing protein n=1 Tax=Nocardioides koreensis TaxID=433651 RepID=UPI0031D4AEE0